MMPGGAQMKVVSMERGGKPIEGYMAPPEPVNSKDIVTPNGSGSSAPPNVMPTPPKGITTITAVRPTYRGPMPASLGTLSY